MYQSIFRWAWSLNLLLLYQFAVAGCCCCFDLLVVEANLFWCLFHYSVWLYSPYYVILVYSIRLTKSERRQRKQFVMHYFLWIWLGIWPHWPSFVDPRVLREWVGAFVLKISKVYTRQIVCWSLCVLNRFHFHKPIPAHNTLARAFLLCFCINRCTCYTHYSVGNEVTYPFPNLNSCTVKVWEWISNFIHFNRLIITYPCWD